MISELFFCFMGEIVEVNFERNPLTQTLTHITIVFYGLGITNQHLLATDSEKTEKLLEFRLQNILLQICAEAIISPRGSSQDNPKGLFVSSYC